MKPLLKIVAGIFTTIAIAAADHCDTVLKLVPDTVRASSESDLSTSAFSYFLSDGFRKSFQSGNYSGGLSIGGFGLNGGASASEIEEWQSKISKLSSSALSSQNKVSYLETSGAKDIAEIWLSCKLGSRPLLVSSIDSGVQSIVTIYYPGKVGESTPATIQSVRLLGCNQLTDHDEDGTQVLALRKGISIPPLQSVSAVFERDNEDIEAYILITTDKGSGWVRLGGIDEKEIILESGNLMRVSLDGGPPSESSRLRVRTRLETDREGETIWADTTAWMNTTEVYQRDEPLYNAPKGFAIVEASVMTPDGQYRYSDEVVFQEKVIDGENKIVAGQSLPGAVASLGATRNGFISRWIVDMLPKPYFQPTTQSIKITIRRK